METQEQSNTQNLFEKTQKELYKNFIELVNIWTTTRNVKKFNELKFFKSDNDFEVVKNIVTSHQKNENDEFHFSKIDKKISRAIASLICSGIGDALGTHTEFLEVTYNRKKNLIEGFTTDKIYLDIYRCYPGEFSDDTSMALCLADNIFVNNYKFNGVDLQIKFLNWWFSSYNNCLFPKRPSFGLGGNIGASLDYFLNYARSINVKKTLTEENLDSLLPEKYENSNNQTNGNGSLMRLAPVPIAFASDERFFEYGKDYAYKQSKVTHSGEEAAEACKLVTHLIMKMISRDTEDYSNFQSYIDKSDAISSFNTDNYSVSCIKNSVMEDKSIFKEEMKQGKYNKKFSKDHKDRNWNWKNKNFEYSPTRAKMMPGYVGSYALDALAMALHLSYFSESPEQAIIRAANMGGDCDTVAAITGQIVGAFYGLNENLLKLYEGVSKYDENKLAYMAYKLYIGEKNENLLK